MRGKLESVTQPKSEKAREKGMKWLKIGENYYSYFGDVSVKDEGKEVEFEYEEKKDNGNTYKNIQQLEFLNDSKRSRKRELIARSVAVKAAASAQFLESEEDVLELATILENYLLEE